MVQAAIQTDKDKNRFRRIGTGKMAEMADLRTDDNNTNEERKILDKVEKYPKTDLVSEKEEMWKQFRLDKVIAHGTFGLVYRGTNLQTGEVVAVKRVYQDTRYKNRELDLLLSARDHPYIMRMSDHYYTNGDRPNDTYLHIVSPLYHQTLGQMVQKARRLYQADTNAIPHVYIPMIAIKMFAWQLLRALGHLHGKGIIHRDVKPQNILVEESKYKLRLCDFGSAKRIDFSNASVSYICSRYYRAPELIFGQTFYNEKIDVWAAACVIAELIKMSPLFPGKDSKRQICEIFKVMGTPSAEEVIAMNENYKNRTFPELVPLAFESNFPAGTPSTATDFLKHLLVYSPAERPGALQALTHPFFNELRLSRVDIAGQGPMPNEMYDFTQVEYNTASRIIEETPLIPEFMAPSWMHLIDRFNKSLHPNSNKKKTKVASSNSQRIQKQARNISSNASNNNTNNRSPNVSTFSVIQNSAANKAKSGASSPSKRGSSVNATSAAKTNTRLSGSKQQR